ncbi:uncharacterized protein LOC141707555 isoform X1 [Apium graveolens]|uniref:uncharacterized protein LOC141707555 isoform X1 n=1 Tax=Apium graveolens TaxID=4045 RepID=UPI003D79EE19
MLEKPTGDSSNVKRYAPPNQRNRLGRRKSGGGGVNFSADNSVENQLKHSVSIVLHLWWAISFEDLEFQPVLSNALRTSRLKPPSKKLERANSYANEGDKAQVAASKKNSSVDRRDASSSIPVNENAPARLISLHGCCESEAFRLLNDRWAATMDAYNNPSIDASERPIMYSGNGASAWGHFRLPHQMDFLNELKRAMWKANGSSNT